MNPIPYLVKELSWLSFNHRVLQEAADNNVPITDRIRFLGIYSSNLNEFFRVRVAEVRRNSLVAQAHESATNPSQDLLDDIIDKVTELTEQFNLVAQQAFNELTKHHIHMVFNDLANDAFNEQLSSYQKQWLNNYFENKIIRHVTPIIINNKTHLVNCLDEDCIYFLVALHQGNDVQYALIEIPRLDVSRFIILPMQASRKKKYIVLLDDVIYYYLDRIFAGFVSYDRIDAFSVELLRDAEYNLTDELDISLLDKMSKGLKQRLTAEPVRLSYDQQMPDFMKKFLYKSIKIKQPDEMMPGVKYRHYSDFIQFPNLGRQNLARSEIKALESKNFTGMTSVFAAIRQGDILLYYPYYKFKHFTEFIRQAAFDPKVEHIKINIYRVAKDSLIINSLIDAVKNGKHVTVIVELRARFDEQANIQWATRMKDAGIHVVFGIDTLKIHSKLCLITRNEHGKKVQYAHIGTGNFHENNARIYTDFALFTFDQQICQEVESVFTFISYSYLNFDFQHLLVSPLNSRARITELIDQEIAIAHAHEKAEITLKVNNLVDERLITKLYEASNAGVKVKLIIRGMCSLVPGIKGYSENIKVISIVDQFLEHPRVMVFRNSGEPLVYISSADWMERNIDHRVEVACPIYDEQLKQRILHTLDLHFRDNTKARIINDIQDNQYVKRGNRKKLRSQAAIYEYLLAEEQK